MMELELLSNKRRWSRVTEWVSSWCLLINLASTKQSDDPESMSAQMFSTIGLDFGGIRVSYIVGEKVPDEEGTEGSETESGKGETEEEDRESEGGENRPLGENNGSELGESRPSQTRETERRTNREEGSERDEAFRRVSLSAWRGASQPQVRVESMGLWTSFLPPKRRQRRRSWQPSPWTCGMMTLGSP